MTSVKRNMLLDNVDCRGDENKLSHCPHAGWGVDDCSRGENVKIECNNKTEGTYTVSSMFILRVITVVNIYLEILQMIKVSKYMSSRDQNLNI